MEVLNCCSLFINFEFQKNMKVVSLFEDIKDGVYLLSLLEVLSGDRLVSFDTPL